MLVLISPAKNLAEGKVNVIGTTAPALLDHAIPVAQKMRSLSAKRIGKLMDLNPKLAQLNFDRYQRWDPDHSKGIPAAFMFNGEVYRGLKAPTLSADDLRFAQHHLRILSGLYGLLRPLDRVQPYRLEMGVKLSMGRGKKDLYAWWKEHVTREVAAALKKSGSNTIINLASDEYAKVIDFEALGAEVISPMFLDRKGNAYKPITVYFKQQRGAMARHIIQHRILDARELIGYAEDGYRFSEEESSATDWIYLRNKPPAIKNG